ncbi:CheW protein, partial [mine drainage metagenome]
IDLRRQLALPERSDGSLPLNVVVRTEDGPVSLLVDEIGDVVDIDESTWEATPPTLGVGIGDLVQGVYKLQNELLLVFSLLIALLM